MLPSVSVIITYHNEGEALLWRAINSIVTQPYAGPIEIIVVDDASEESPKLPRSKRVSLRLIRSKKNIFLPAARNLGVKHAQSKYLVFLDADDVFLGDRIKSQVDFAEKHSDLSFVGGGGYIHRFGRKWLHFPPIVKEILPNHMWKKNLVMPNSTQRVICYTYPFHSCGFTLNRDIFYQVGGFDESLKWGEEWDIQIRLAQFGPVGYVACPGYKYIQRDGSITQVQDPKKKVSLAKIMQKALKLPYDFSKDEKLRIKAKRRDALLLAGQLFYELNQAPWKALNCAIDSLREYPSVWGIRSVIRYCFGLLFSRDFKLKSSRVRQAN